MNNRLDVIKHWYNKDKSISNDDLEWLIGYAEESLYIEDDLRKTIDKLYNRVSELSGVLCQIVEIGNRTFKTESEIIAEDALNSLAEALKGHDLDNPY